MGLRNKILFLTAAGLCMFPLADSAYPQARPNAAAPSAGAGTAEQQTAAAMAKAWTLFYAGKYEAAATTVQPLLKSDKHEVQAESAHLFARCLWAANTGNTRDQAQKLWKQLDQPLAGSAVTLHLAVARALALDDQTPAKTTDAIDLLNREYILKGNSGGVAQAEAAIELAQLYREAGGAGNLDEAGKLLDAIPQFFSGDNLTRLEVEPTEVQPFLKAAAAAKAGLKYDAQPGLADFEKAEKLRAAGKFPQAIAAYQQIIKKYPTTDFAPHSDLCIGYCLLGMKDLPKAIDHWKTFTAAAPGGPWRGQAFVALIDIDLEHQLDLPEAAKQAELAAGAISAAVDDNQSASQGGQGGWKAVAFDLYLRIGVVQFIQGKDSAADAFTQAASSDGIAQQTKDSLTALADAAKSGKPILPAGLTSDTAGKPGQTALALKIGVIYNVADRFDHATSFFDRVAKGEFRDATAAELAFADFGKAAALQGQNKLAAAKDEYLASIKADGQGGQGGWQDESFYRIARLIEAQANAQFPAPPVPSDDAAAKPKPMTSAQLDQQNAAERDRQAKLFAAKKSALPYWDALLKQFPASPRIPSAEYHAAVLLWQLQQWPDATALFNKLVAAYPKDPLAGDAYVRLIDIDLEDTFSLKDAETASAAAVKWASWNTDAAPAAPSDTSAPPVEPWRVTAFRDPQPDLKASAYAIYLRAGLTAYMDQKMDQSAELLKKGNDFDTSARAQMGGGVETGISRMIDIAAGRAKPLTPAEILPLLKDDKQKTGVVLADLYLTIFSPDKAGPIYQRLLAADAPFPNPSAGVQAYLLLRIGQALEFQHKHDDAIAYLKQLYDPKYAGFPWTAEGIFRIGTWSFNATQDPKQGMEHWKYVFTTAPKSPDAEYALFYYAITAARTKDYKTAAAAFQEYLDRYPNGRWTKRIEKEELPDALQHLSSKN